MKKIFFLLFICFFFYSFYSDQKENKQLLLERNLYTHTTIPKEAESQEQLTIEFLGTACIHARLGNTALLTDPFVSNPNLKTVLFGKTVTDTNYIVSLLPNLSMVKAVVVGHSHYDHLLDLPYIATKHLNSAANIYASNTAFNLLHSVSLPQPQIAVNKNMATHKKTGNWLYTDDKSIRILPIYAEHAPHFLGITVANNTLDTPLKKVPTSAAKWQAGTTLCYLIDFLVQNIDSIKIKKRIYFQSSTAEPPLGFYPEHLNDEHSVDVAIIAIVSDIDKIASTLRFINPKTAYFIHWEDFLKKRHEPLKPNSKANLKKLEQLKQQQTFKHIEMILPKPGSIYNSCW